MTNVPEDIRTALADAYKLFDVSFRMAGTDEDWQKYWEKACELIKKYGDEIPLLVLFEGYAKVIEKAVKRRENHSLEWKAGEDYPYPLKGEI